MSRSVKASYEVSRPAGGHAVGWSRVKSAVLVLTSAVLLSACGGGGGSSDTDSDSHDSDDSSTAATSASATSAFPKGLAVAAPGDVSNGTVSAARVDKGWQVALDWGHAVRSAWQDGNTRQLARLAALALPIGSVQATASGAAEISAKAELIEQVLSGDSSVTLANVLDLASLFQASGSNASCYGPQVAYANHDDGGGTASGTLPSGDVGLWKAEESTGRPCAVAQMSRRVHGVKQQTTQALLLAAFMRRTVALSTSLSLPAAGGQTDLTSELSSRLAAALPTLGATVSTATLALDSAGSTYTYRLVLTSGSGSTAKRGEVILRHTPGSSTSQYSGVLQVAGFTYDSDPAFACTDQTDGSGNAKVARISTVRYSRSGTTVDFGARSSRFCGHPAASGTDDAAQVASFTSAHELDPAVKISGSTRGSTLGWRGDFTRYAASFDKDLGTGQFLMAWQAGTGDSHSRMLATRSTRNSATGDRSLEGWFAYGGEVSTTSGALLGMICNWAGPGNAHTPNTQFQSQQATRTAGALAWTLGTSKITYAPTRSCSSTTTAYDANGDGSLASGEGVGTMAGLDGLTGTRTTVSDELSSRGYSQPGLF